MCKNGESLQGVRLIDHILQKHREELHLPETVSATDLFAKLQNAEIEILPKFSRIFNALGQWLICFYLTPSVSILYINLLFKFISVSLSHNLSSVLSHLILLRVFICVYMCPLVLYDDIGLN